MSNGFDDLGLDRYCDHGKRIGDCRQESCKSIAEVLRIKPGTPTKVEPWFVRSESEIRADETRYEKWLEERAAGRYERNSPASDQQVLEQERTSRGRWRSLLEVFPADTKASKRGLPAKSIRHAKRLQHITEREAGILAELQRSGGDVSYSHMARRLGWSADTIARDYKSLVLRFLGHREPASLSGGDLIARRVKGERGIRYWRVRESRFGEFQSILLERVEVGQRVRDSGKVNHRFLTRREISKLRSEGRLQQRPKIAYCGPSQMNVVFAAVCAELASPRDEQLVHRYDHIRELPEWVSNVAKARKLVQGKRRSWDEPSYADVGARLKRKLPRCDWCRTPILVGLCLNGKRIKRLRGRQFCGNACKMKRYRRETK